MAHFALYSSSILVAQYIFTGEGKILCSLTKSPPPANTLALSRMIWWHLCNLVSFFLRHKTDLKFLWEQSFTEWKLCHGIRKYNLEEINTFCGIFLIYPTVFIHHSKNSKPSFYTKVSVTECFIGVHHLLFNWLHTL